MILCKIFHGIFMPRGKKCENSRETPWDSLETPWDSVETPWNSMEPPWSFNMFSISGMKILRIISRGITRSLREKFHVFFPWNSMRYKIRTVILQDRPILIKITVQSFTFKLRFIC